MQLDAVAQNPRHLGGEVRLYRDPVALHFAARQGEDVPDRGVEVEPVLLGGRFLGEGANPADDFAGAMAVGDDPRGGLPGFLQVLRREPAHTGTGVIDHGAERLIDFMGDRGRSARPASPPA